LALFNLLSFGPGHLLVTCWGGVSYYRAI